MDTNTECRDAIRPHLRAHAGRRPKNMVGSMRTNQHIGMPYSSNKSSASCSDSRSRSRATGTRADTLAQTNCVEKAGKRTCLVVGLNRTRMGYERPSFYAATSHCRRGRHTQFPCWVCTFGNVHHILAKHASGATTASSGRPR